MENFTFLSKTTFLSIFGKSNYWNTFFEYFFEKILHKCPFWVTFLSKFSFLSPYLRIFAEKVFFEYFFENYLESAILVWVLVWANSIFWALFLLLFWAISSWALFWELFWVSFWDFSAYETFMKSALRVEVPYGATSRGPWGQNKNRKCLSFGRL